MYLCSFALAWFDLIASTVHVFLCIYMQDECDIELDYIVWLDVIAPLVTDVKATTAGKAGNADHGNGDGSDGSGDDGDYEEEDPSPGGQQEPADEDEEDWH